MTSPQPAATAANADATQASHLNLACQLTRTRCTESSLASSGTHHALQALYIQMLPRADSEQYTLNLPPYTFHFTPPEALGGLQAGKECAHPAFASTAAEA